MQEAGFLDGRRRRAAASQEHRIDGVGANARALDAFLDASGDFCAFRTDRLLEQRPRGLNQKSFDDRGQVYGRGGIVRKKNFRFFRFSGDPMAGALMHDPQETLYSLRFFGDGAQMLQLRLHLVGVEERNPVPQGELVEIAVWQVELRALALARLIAEMRHDLLQAEFIIEIRAADVDARIGENVLFPVRAVSALGGHPDDREIGRSAADVGDQRDLLSLDAMLIVKRRRDRLILKLDMLEALRARDLHELVLGDTIGLGVAIDEKDRPPENHLLDWRARLFFRGFLDMAKEAAEDRGEFGPLPTRHGGFIDERAAEDAFDGAEETPVLAFDIGVDRTAAKADASAKGRIEDRAGDGRAVALDLHERRRSGLHEPCGGVRCPKVNSAGWAHVHFPCGRARGHARRLRPSQGYLVARRTGRAFYEA